MEETRLADTRRERVELARELQPALTAARGQAYLQRRVPDHTMGMLKESGLLRLLQPSAYGGPGDGDYLSVLLALEELALACPSTGWVAAVLTEHMWVVGSFPGEAQQEVWGNDSQAMCSSSFAPRSTARPAPGGFRLSGKWSFSSGCDHASWVCVGAYVEDESGKPAVHYFLVPKREVEVIDDWFVFGLAGTGSKSLVLDDIYVPAHRVLLEELTLDGRVPGSDVHPDYRLLRAKRGEFAPLSLTPVMVAIAQQTFDLVVSSLGGRVSRGIKVAESETTQMRISEAASQINIARGTFHALCERSQRALASGGAGINPLDTRRDVAFSSRMLRDAVLTLCDLTGGAYVYDGHPLQQLLRDMLTAASHRIMQWDAAAAMSGRHELNRRSAS